MLIRSVAPSSRCCEAEMSDVLGDLVTAGAAVAATPDGRPAALLCRRMTFDRVLRNAAANEPGVRMRHRACRPTPARAGPRCGRRGRRSRHGSRSASLTRRAELSRFTSSVRMPVDGGRLWRDLRHPAVRTPRGGVRRAGQLTHRPRTEPSGLLGHRVCSRQPHRFGRASPMTASTDDYATCGSTTSSPSGARHPAAVGLDRPDTVAADYPGACPAAGCTTPTAGSSTMRAGRCCPG